MLYSLSFENAHIEIFHLYFITLDMVDTSPYAGTSGESIPMADPEVRIAFEEESGDMELQGDGEMVDASEIAGANGDSEAEDESASAEQGKLAPRVTFVEYVPPAVSALASCDFD